MKRLSRLWGVVLSIFLLGSFAHAATITYTHDPADFLIGNNPAPQNYQYAFTGFLTDFQPGSVTGGTLTVYLKDDRDFLPFMDRFALKANDSTAYSSGFLFEMPNVLTAYYGSVLASALNSGSILAYIQRNGPFNDFIFDRFELSVTGTPVPVPAAAWMLGAGLVGLVAIRRVRRER